MRRSTGLSSAGDGRVPVGPDGLARRSGPARASEYVEVCRALIRNGGDSTRRIEEVLAAHGLTPRGWAVISADWTKRIRRDPDLRSKFQRLYVGPTVEPSAGNE